MAAATAVKLHLRASRLQEAAALLQERAWAEEAVRDLAKRGRFLMGVITKKCNGNHAPSRAAGPTAVLGCTGLIPSSRPTTMKSAGIIPTDPVESLVTNCNLGARRDCGCSPLTLQSVQAPAAVAAAADKGRDNQGVAIETELYPLEDDEYRWETDPNGGWLASFP